MKTLLIILCAVFVCSGCSTEPEETIASGADGIWIVYVSKDGKPDEKVIDNFRFDGGKMYFMSAEYQCNFDESSHSVGLHREENGVTTDYGLSFGENYKSFTGGGIIKKIVNGKKDETYVSFHGDR